MTNKTRSAEYQAVRDLRSLEKKSQYHASAPFITSLSVILGVILAVGMILGVVGDAFYVSRREYTDKRLKDLELTSNFNSTLNQLKETMALQAANFKEMTVRMEQIRIELAHQKK